MRTRLLIVALAAAFWAALPTTAQAELPVRGFEIDDCVQIEREAVKTILSLELETLLAPNERAVLGYVWIKVSCLNISESRRQIFVQLLNPERLRPTLLERKIDDDLSSPGRARLLALVLAELLEECLYLPHAARIAVPDDPKVVSSLNNLSVPDDALRKTSKPTLPASRLKRQPQPRPRGQGQPSEPRDFAIGLTGLGWVGFEAGQGGAGSSLFFEHRVYGPLAYRIDVQLQASAAGIGSEEIDSSFFSTGLSAIWNIAFTDFAMHLGVGARFGLVWFRHDTMSINENPLPWVGPMFTSNFTWGVLESLQVQLGFEVGWVAVEARGDAVSLIHHPTFPGAPPADLFIEDAFAVGGPWASFSFGLGYMF